ncbi:TetR/AcrR family transcriptional regulator [Chitinophaga varians]|uniref:TetR/AcrR family transcriptional regulator n=1 Tax=Chitinophaga varians TaxID=2202339 RepID=A0A847RU64_9BACT|nr:TetR/AcrR family transcriptional regulator [Chitinophaga varians]NLR66522.1 TetR/AcrR family transcriptional regulator [Chitinophaga varians]
MKEEWHQLLDSGTTLFARKGIRATSTDEIARQCGLHKRCFYEHFNSKESLVAHIIGRWLEKTDRYLSFNRHISSNAIIEMSNFFRIAERVILTTQPVFFRDLRDMYPDIWAGVRQFRENQLATFLRLNIRRGLEEDIYRHNLDQTLLEKLYFTPLELVMNDRIPPECPVYRACRELNIIYLHGLVNLKGMKLIYEKQVN